MSDEMAVAADQAMQDSSIIEEQSPEPFVQLDLGDEQLSFNDRDELSKWAKESALRQSDYTRKTQTLAEERRKFETEQTRLQEEAQRQREELAKAKEKYDRYEEALRRRPNIAQELDRLATQPASPEEIFERSKGYADERLTELQQKLEELESQREREQLERQRDEIYSRLGERYTDFDKDAVANILNTLEEGNLEPLLEMAYKASRYGSSGTEEQVLEKLQRKQGASLPSGGGKPPPPKSGSADPKEAYEEALREYAGIA